jgi:putative two-component system response regulator
LKSIERFRILVVDDQEDILEDYMSILAPGKDGNRDQVEEMEKEIFGSSRSRTPVLNCEIEQIDVSAVTQGEEAITAVRDALNDHPFSVVFMDVRMPPGIDGVKAAFAIRKIDPDIEIVIVTAYSDYNRQEIREIIAGEREDENLYYLKKPFHYNEIWEMAHALLRKWRLNKKVKENTREIRKVHATTILTLASLAELRDDDTGSHLKRVSIYTKMLATELSKLPEPIWCEYITPLYVADIGESCILHDIGKVGIADAILLKPGKLTEEEFDIMKTHTTIGGNVLSDAVMELGNESFLTLACEIAYHHHEKWDGSGYPRGLKGEEIPLSARIMALADVYDALSSDRPYRKALPEETVYKIITEEMGPQHFDPTVLQIFCNCIEEFKKVRNKFS